MPNGKVHDRITVVAATLSVPAWFYLTTAPRDWGAAAVLAGATLFSGIALSPDLDLNSGVYRRWGIFRHLWWPYQKLIPHRSFLSHSFFLGPLLRVLYFLSIVWVIFRSASWLVDRYLVPVDRNALGREWSEAIVHYFELHPQQLTMLAVGLLLGAALHCAADLIVSGIKRRF